MDPLVGAGEVGGVGDSFKKHGKNESSQFDSQITSRLIHFFLLK